MSKESAKQGSEEMMSQGQGGQQGIQGGGEMMSAGVSDAEFDLISLVYHALQAAEVYHVYLEDAEQEGLVELQQLLHEAREQNMMIARRAREILFKQAGGGK